MAHLEIEINGLGRKHLRHREERRPQRFLKKWVLPSTALVTASIYSGYFPGDFALETRPPPPATYQATIKVAGTVENPRVDEVLLYVNGVPATVPVSGGRFHSPVDLAPGANLLRAFVAGIPSSLTPGSEIVRIERLMLNTRPVEMPNGTTVAEGSPQRVEASELTFEVQVGSPPPPGARFGVIGGGGYFVARIHFRPLYEAPGDGSLRLDFRGKRGHVEQLERRQPSGLAAIFWPPDFLGHPSDHITEVRAIFDGSAVVCEPQASRLYVAYIPKRARRFEGIEADWHWQDAQIKRRLTFR